MVEGVSEHTALLSGNPLNGESANDILPRYRDGTDKPEPSWTSSFNYFLFGSWFNIFLLAVPLSFLSHWLNWDAGLRFLFSFIAIMPLAKLLGDATEQLSLKLGDTVSGLLNATFGNAVEVIVAIAALLQDELRIVQTSLLGSILSNLLLVLGCSFIAGGWNRLQNTFNKGGAQMNSSLMTLACITLVLPAAYHSSKKNQDDTLLYGGKMSKIDASRQGLLTISRGTSILLLFVYIAFLYFQLVTHTSFFRRKALGCDHPVRVDSVTSTLRADDNYISHEIAPQSQNATEEPEEMCEELHMNVYAAGVGLLLSTIVTSFCADYLVASIEETADRYGIPKTFIGIILLPLVSNAAEHVTSVWMAMKDKFELTIGICVGSSIQIATFVIPLLVIVGWITGHELTLFFADFETVTLFASVLLVNVLIMDGKSNYLEGVMLVTLYIVIGLAFWVK